VKHEGLHDLYIAPNIIPVSKSRRIVTGGACSTYGVRRMAYRISVRKLEKEGHLEDLGGEKKNYIRIDLQEIEWGTWLGLWDFGDSNNEPSGSIKRGEFLDCVKMYSFLNKASAPL
jgi:hypothetical protein